MRRFITARSLVVFAVAVLALLVFSVPKAMAQETTGGIQGTVTDPSGAAVPGAHLTLTGTTLVGSKEADADAKGNYQFTNLPPGTYDIKASAQGFETLDRADLSIAAGHTPTVDLQLQIGAAQATVEVTGAAPLVDVTQTQNVDSLTENIVSNIPHGYSYQSVLQFAPMTRNEPLAGGVVGPNAAMGTGTGGQSAGSGTNGQAFGYSTAGGADSENSYLVDGMETADPIGGFSKTNVPFSFIQEVDVKDSGVVAQYGGAMGGVMNVIMKKGTSNYHGSVFTQFERGSWDAAPSPYPRYDASFPGGSIGAARADATPQVYSPAKDGLSNNFPGFAFGGPLLPSLKNRLWFFVGFNPEFLDTHRTAVWNFPGNSAFPATTGPTTFTSSQASYYSNARVDAAVTQKIRAFGSWLYEYQRESGEFLPQADSINGLVNNTATAPAAVYGHNLGYSAPNVTSTVGTDITLTPRLVATFRWGYNFQNYHDFGMPTGGAFDSFATGCVTTSSPPCTDNTGAPITGTQLNQLGGYFSAPNNINNTTYDVTHRNDIDADVSWFHSGWAGAHTFQFGYQLIRLSNSVLQHFNEPNVTVFPGKGNYYTPISSVGTTNCTTLEAPPYSNPGCAGKYGYLYFQDYGSNGQATSMNHALYAQDSWQVMPGLTINAGIRVEHEYLPAEDQPLGGISKPIQFGWGSKVAPRIGVSWDPTKTGKWKIYADYAKYFDIMKLNLAISSFGGQYWQNCYYALNTTDLSAIVPVFDSNTRYCSGPSSGSQANLSPATQALVTSNQLIFLENQNFRTFPTSCATCTATEEGVAPGLNPYSEHELVFGVEHQLTNHLAFEARYDRRRLDNAIEDAALFNGATGGETFVIVNPGKGVNQTFDGFYKFLYATPSGCGASTFACPPNLPTAVRDYDGVEFRLTMAPTRNWGGMVSYTYSRLWGNYTGLTNTDISDGGGGRNAPNNSRAFDEPFFYYDAAGQVNNGPLATDRPNAFKDYGYYDLKWLNKFSTTFGMFQYFYQGSPVSSYVDMGYSFSPSFGAYNVPNAEGGAFPTYILPRGQWLPLSQDPTTGAVNVGTPYSRRTPWFMQTDFQISQDFNIGESKKLSFSVTVPNIFNQRSVVAYWEGADTNFYSQFLTPPGSAANCPEIAPLNLTAGQCFIGDGGPFYSAAMHGYNYKALFNAAGGSTGTAGGPITINSLYGKPLYYQVGRTMYMSVKFEF